MNIFTYENIWFTITFWSFISLGSIIVALGLFIMGNPFGKRWVAVWVSAFLAMVALVGFIIVDHDKLAQQKVHNQSVVDHIKTTAGFDSVEGEYDPNGETASAFTGHYGDDKITCLAGAEPGSTTIEFGCGTDFTPLDKTKEMYLAQKKADKSTEKDSK